MDLPPSGWYPDPYGRPALLRWWDGVAWTRHTHADEAGTAAARGLQTTAVQATSVQATSVQATSVQATAVQATSAGATRVQAASAQPAAGPPTSPQPGLPGTTVQPTVYQPSVTAGRPGAGDGADGTQVLFLGPDAWQAPGAPADPARYGYGYRRAQRRRRWLMGGLALGTAVAVAVIAFVVVDLGSSRARPAAAPRRLTPSASAPATPAPAPTPSASPSASASGPAATLSDGQSGLSYPQLASPWQPTCPTALTNGAFTWTSGESAIAGQVDGGQTTWYGEACSGPLPQQYGYSGVASLESTATNLANTFQGTYYSALNHSATPEVSQPVTISGHAGWEVTFAVTYTSAQAQGASWTDEQGAVVVVDTGPGKTPAVFFASIPANLGESSVATLVSSLQLSVVPQPSGSPTLSGTPAPSGTPSDGGSPNDNGSPAAGANP